MSNRLGDIAQWVWDGDDAVSRAVRVSLAPAAALFAIAVARRNARFNEDVSHDVNERRMVRAAALPAISVGNLTVGGTGKTPVAAWCVRELRKAGAKPAIVMRGYGDDEWRVHSLLNPGVPVIVSPDRLNGIAAAKAQGANCVVLDDAFQHRQAARIVDAVLMSADAWSGRARLLPAGPFREPMSALARATVVVITAKAADAERIERLQSAILAAAPKASIAVVRLQLGELKLVATALASVAGKAPVADQTGLLDRPISWLSGKRVIAVSAIGDPVAFASQLQQCGATVERVQFRDHHSFSEGDAVAIAKRARETDGVVCTLKDAVKLGPLWPRVAPPLWYVSQSVVVERGASALDRALARVLAARERNKTAIAPTAG